ncbi:hypothetical protein OGATHE_001101 [Ogataea polymorpha]|uniref:Uncharacterized protein n=1 Tax=Ogataea polymorpha TaxID=460523 RepID=A0A9P8PR78_9ASCO|nr:hypothetical protein OGATHE_001101 [Ogataea polymorpha]
MHSGSHVRLLLTDELLQLEKLDNALDVRGKEIGGRLGEVLVRHVTRVFLQIQSDRGARRARTGESDHKPQARVELHVQTLFARDRAVKVGVREVGGFNDLTGAPYRRADELLALIDLVLQQINHLRCISAIALLQVQPGHNGPQSVLLSDVVRASTERFFSADGQFLGVEKRTEKLPSGRHLVDIQALGLGNKVECSRGRHRSRQAVDAVFLEVWDALCVLRNDSNRVSRGDKSSSSVDHVSISISIRSRTKCNIFSVHSVHQRPCRIEQNFEALRRLFSNKRPDEVQVENLLDHRHIRSGGINDLDFQLPIRLCSNSRQIHLRQVLHNLVGLQFQRGLVDLVGDRLRGRSSIAQVILDSTVVVWSSRVVRRSQNDTSGHLLAVAVRTVRSDDP